MSAANGDGKSAPAAATATGSDGKSSKALTIRPTIHLNPKQPNVPLYSKQEFDKQPNGIEQTVLRLIVRPVSENERLRSIKSAVEKVLGQHLYHMGVLDVKNNRIYHFNDPIGGNSPSAAAAANGNGSHDANHSNNSGSGSRKASVESAAAPPPPPAASVVVALPIAAAAPIAKPIPINSAGSKSGGPVIIRSLPPSPSPPAQHHVPHENTTATGGGGGSGGGGGGAAPTATDNTTDQSYLSALAAHLLPTVQTDKLSARWVSASITEFVGRYTMDDLLYVDVRIPLELQHGALAHAIEMAETYLLVTAQEVPAYDALRFNCQHMCFRMLGGEWDTYSGQADMLVTQAVAIGSKLKSDGEEWVSENKKKVMVGLGMGVVVGLLVSWATGKPPDPQTTAQLASATITSATASAPPPIGIPKASAVKK